MKIYLEKNNELSSEIYSESQFAINPDGFTEVEMQDRPKDGYIYKIGNVKKSGKKFVAEWIKNDTDEAFKIRKTMIAKSQRDLRDRLLQKSDWTQGKDIPDAISSEWAKYRKSLRELPQQENFPFDVKFPIPPKA